MARKKGRTASSAPGAPPHQARSVDRACVVQQEFREDLQWWVENDRKTALRVLTIMEAVMRTPFEGIAKPEPLRHLGSDIWSRRLTAEHRVVYVVADERIDFLQCRYHY